MKPSLIKKDDSPIHGLKSSKNYVVANKVDNILSPAKKLPEKQNFLKKESYGQIPNYLR